MTLTAAAAAVAPVAWAQPRRSAPSGLNASLRASARRSLPAAAGLRDLGELPHYALDMDIDIDLGRYTLRETLDYRNDTGAPLTEVALRVYANAVPGPPPVNLARAHCPDTQCTADVDNPTALTFRPSTPIPPGGRLRMQVELTGTLRVTDASRTNLLTQGLEGLATLGSNEHRGDYGLLSVGDGIASFANFYAVIARRGDSGWVRTEASTMGDLGSDHMAHVEATIRTAPDVALVSTGVTTRRRAVGRAMEHEIAASMVRDFTVLASRRLTAATRQVGDVTIRSWFLPADRAAGEQVLDVATESFRVFERRFGGYPYTELDVVEAPLVGGAGGVEFAGLVTVASMFYRPSGLGGLEALLGAGADQARMREMVTAHEVAHQWWHGLVGSDSREHPFVDESLAQWSALLYLEERYGAERAAADGDAQVEMNYRMMRMLGRPDGPVNRPVDAFDSSLEYAGLIYGKGVYVYPALRAVVGDRDFFSAIRDYVDRYRHRHAPRRGLVDVLAAGRRGPEVEAIARHWLEEAHGDADIGRGTGPMAALGGQLGGQLGAPSTRGRGLGGATPGGQLGSELGVLQSLLGGDGAGVDVGALLDALGGADLSDGQTAPSPAEMQRLQQQLESMMRELGAH